MRGGFFRWSDQNTEPKNETDCSRRNPAVIEAQIAPVQTAPLLAWCKMASGLRILRVATLEKQSDLSCVVAKVQKPEKR